MKGNESDQLGVRRLVYKKSGNSLPLIKITRHISSAHIWVIAESQLSIFRGYIIGVLISLAGCRELSRSPLFNMVHG